MHIFSSFTATIPKVAATPHHLWLSSSSSKLSCASGTGLACLGIKYSWKNCFLGEKTQKRCHSPTAQAEDRLLTVLLCFNARHHCLHFIVKQNQTQNLIEERVNHSHSMCELKEILQYLVKKTSESWAGQAEPEGPEEG